MPYTPEEKCRLSGVLIVVGLLLIVVSGVMIYYVVFHYWYPVPDWVVLLLFGALVLGVVSVVLGIIWYSYCIEIRILRRLAEMERKERRRRKKVAKTVKSLAKKI